MKQLPVATLPVDPDAPIITSVPPDILHIRPRIGEKKMRGLISAAGKHQKNKMAPLFQELIKSVGIKFKISEGLVHGKPQICFSSLTGKLWRKLLSMLPGLIRGSNDVFSPVHKEPLAMVMQQLNECLELAANGQPEDAPTLAQMTNKWINSFLRLGDMGLEHFQKKDLTPYCHWFNVHVPYALSLYGGLSKLSGELVENQNDQIKRTFLQRCHHKDLKQTLLIEKRREHQMMMRELERSTKPQRAEKTGPKHTW